MGSVVFDEVIGTVQRDPADASPSPAGAGPAPTSAPLDPEAVRRYLHRLIQLEARLRAD